MQFYSRACAINCWTMLPNLYLCQDCWNVTIWGFTASGEKKKKCKPGGKDVFLKLAWHGSHVRPLGPAVSLDKQGHNFIGTRKKSGCPLIQSGQGVYSWTKVFLPSPALTSGDGWFSLFLFFIWKLKMKIIFHSVVLYFFRSPILKTCLCQVWMKLRSSWNFSQLKRWIIAH